MQGACDKKIRVAVVGYGNIGRYAVEAVRAAGDLVLAGVVSRRAGGEKPVELTDVPVVGDIQGLEADAAMMCVASREVETFALPLLAQGIHTADSFDIHSAVLDLRGKLDAAAKQGNAVAITAAGWDPGSDSVIRALWLAMAPRGITYTNFGPGMSMGHTVAAKSKPGVADALSMTIPAGAGTHRRMVYVQLADGADANAVKDAIKSDAYFCHDETQVIIVEDVRALTDRGSGVHMTRKGVAGLTDNQLFSFDMRVNNPALTAQVLVACVRAACRQRPGAYTMIEIPPVDLLPGAREGYIQTLV